MMERTDRWPDFLIIGAGKSGTTSMYSYLREHPQVCMPDFKEPSFFTSPEVEGIRTRTDYLDLFRHCSGAEIVGEASVVYLLDPQSPGLIHEALGDSVKLVCILRNPVDMMYSAWAHATRTGEETRPAHIALPAAFQATRLDLSHRHLMHAFEARYDEQLARYSARFPRENIKVFLFEEFFAEGLPLYPELCRFLGVDDSHTPVPEVHNKGFMAPRSQLLHRFVNEHYGTYILPLARRLFPQCVRRGVRRRLDAWNISGAEAIPPLDAALRREVCALLDGSVRNLERLLGRDLRQVWF